MSDPRLAQEGPDHSVSRSLAALEREVGIELVQRATRRSNPTDAGLTFYRRLNAVLAEIESAKLETANRTRRQRAGSESPRRPCGKSVRCHSCRQASRTRTAGEDASICRVPGGTPEKGRVVKHDPKTRRHLPKGRAR
ncbi:MAG: LysR family transcriptional regulator [Xanthobacteraceae bacterium]